MSNDEIKIETITFVSNEDETIRATVYGYFEDEEDNSGWVDVDVEFENFTDELLEKFEEIHYEEGGNQDTLYEMGFYDVEETA